MRQRGGLFHLLKISMILAIAGVGFFCTKNALASQSLLISEVQITGGSGKTGNDFIELYNLGDAPVNLKGYRLVKRTKTGATDTNIKSWTTDVLVPANGYYLWANSNYLDIAVTPNATTTATISDDNGIAIRFGAADTGVIIDSVAWGGAENIFIEGAVFSTNPGANQSLERRLNSDTGDNSADFFIQANPNPRSSEIAAPPAEPPDNPPAEPPAQTETAASTTPNLPSSASSGKPENSLGEVVINELVSDPADNEVEWIELYNKTSREIDLTGWWLEDGSSAKTSLEGSLGASGSSRYKIVEKPRGVLNNEGDLIVLYNGGGKIIDQAAYGGWADGNPEDNAPVAHDPASVARKFDGYNTFNNANDFAATLQPTKGASNLIQVEDETSAETKAGFDFSHDIHISEVLPNPEGDDTKLEFIEIYNAGTREVNLAGWRLSNEDNKKINLEKIATSTIIKAGEYLALFRPKTKLVLHNDQGEVKLFEPLADQPAQIVKYKEVKDGWSYNLADYKISLPTGQAGGQWVWSKTVTPGALNILQTINHAPEVEFNLPKEALVGQPVSFDSSDTDDIDGDSLKYAWDFGDGFKNSLANPEHTFFESGIYQVKLAVSDGQETTEKVKSLKAVNNVSELVVDAETLLDQSLLEEAAMLPPGSEGGIIINEIFPNPAGADTGSEWAELKNQGPGKVNLLNWRLENSNGKYKFKNDLWLEQESFYLLTNLASKLAFKNDSDVISLYNDLDELIDRVEYAGAVQGEGYARGANHRWFWTAKVTPARENVISLSDSQSVVLTKAAGAAANSDSYIETTLEKIKELEIGSLVKASGIVAVEPGILGVQIFYIAASSSGIQIYNYKKNFPTLKAGDQVEVSGELAQTQDEFRIKTKTKADIRTIGHNTALSASSLSCDAISEENIGQLITITGEITDKKAATAYLDDGNGEILVYFKQSAGLDTKSFKAGQMIMVTGILSKTQTGLRLLPRYQADLAKISETVIEPQVLGEAIESQEWAVAERDKKNELFKYLLIIAAGAIIVLVGLFARIKRKNVV